MIEVTWAKSTFIYFGIAMNYPLNKEANFCFAVHEACLLDLFYVFLHITQISVPLYSIVLQHSNENHRCNILDFKALFINVN